MIPKIIHQFWTGEPMPAAYRRFIEGWRQLHPEWELILWGEERPIPKLKNQDLYDRAAEIVDRHIIPLQSDILRYELLYKFGGVWVDTDIEPLRAVDELLAGLEAFATWELQDEVAANGFMGCTKGHPLAKALVDGIEEAVAKRRSKEASVITGPHYLTSKLTPDVVMLPQKYFFPYKHRETDVGWYRDYPEAYGIHHFGSAEHLLDIPVVRRNSELPPIPPTTKHRVVVFAQGRAARWEGYMNIPKHLVNVEGERVVARTARLFAERGCDVVVVGPPDERYRVDGAQLVTFADPAPTGTAMDEMVNAVLLSGDKRTSVVYGDCYYTDEAADTIARHRGAGLHYYRRLGPSKFTGRPWGEGLGFTFTASVKAEILRTAAEAVKVVTAAGIPPEKVCIGHYQLAMAGLDVNNYDLLAGLPDQTEIHDWTDDFDYPGHYRGWMRSRGTKLPISIVIMAHPDREEWAEALGEELGASVIYDRGKGHIDTALRCLEAYHPQATHHIILQDDAIPANGFREMAMRVAAVVGPEPVSYYTGAGGANYAAPAKERFTAALDAKASWFLCEGPFWAVGVAHPVARLPEVIQLFKASSARGDDTRLMAAYKDLGLRCWYPVPSLVDHRDDGSLIWKGSRTGRVAIKWLKDARDFDPYGEVLPARFAPAAARKRGYVTIRHKASGRTISAREGAPIIRRYLGLPTWERVRA